MRCRTLLLGLFAFFSVLAQAAEDKRHIDIPAEPLDKALREFADQTGLQLAFETAITAGHSSPAIKGDFTNQEILLRLLDGSGLRFVFLDDRTVAISPTESFAPGEALHLANADAQEAGVSNTDRRNWTHLSQADGAQSSAGEVTADAQDKVQLAEVLVTAQKREERLQDVPVPVTVIKTDDLVANNQVLLQDFYATVPGLMISATGAQNTTNVVIRGVATGGGYPTVGVLVDGLPFTSSLNRSSGYSVPDIDPGDLARVEVLRGPQGTLYGANSMGGLINYVTADPSTSAFSARVQAGVSGVSNGAELGYNFRASVNVPVTDTFALQASAFKRQDPGYIDNPLLNLQGINEHEADGGRVAFKWTPFDFLTWKISALYESIKSKGSDDINSGPGYSDPLLSGGLQQNYPPNVGGYTRTVQNLTSTLTIKMDKVTFTSLSGYSVHSIRDSWDFTPQLGTATCQEFPTTCQAGVGATPVTDDTTIRKFSQELRLSGSLWSRLDWLVGTFYTIERMDYLEDILAEDPAGQIAGTWAHWITPSEKVYNESAVFSDLTYHFSDRLDLQVGGRESWLRANQTPLNVSTGVLNGPVGTPAFTSITPKQWSSDTKLTFLITASYKITPDDMVYARIASGYRPGVSNIGNLPIANGVPAYANPDSTVNYELGIKGGLFDHAIFLDASVYYIDWKNIQTNTVTSDQYQLGYVDNAGGAKSEGVEISAETKPFRGLTLSGWFDYNNAVLTKNFPPGGGYGNAGDRLPYGAKLSGNLSIKQEFPLWNDVRGFVGGSVLYVGGRLGTFTGTAADPRQDYPAYTQTNLLLGAIYNSWSFNGYLNNIADVRGVVGGGIGSFPPTGFEYITPRTIGINAVKTF